MGNVLLRGVVHRHGRGIKILKADGSVMKLRSPLSVKEILVDYPNHQIFEAPAGPPLGMGSFSRPLQERAELVAAHLYYLIPFPQDELIDYNNNINGSHFSSRAFSYHSIPSGSSRLQPQSSAEIGRHSIKEEVDNVFNNIKDSIRIISSSYSTDGSRVRVKLRVRKEEVASLLSAKNVNVVMEKVLVPSLIEYATRQSAALSRWKPSLDTIAEPHSPLGDL